MRIVLLLLIVWLIMSLQFSNRWYGAHDSTRVWVASSIRNYQLYGIERNTLLMSRDVAPTPPEERLHYTHHPSMIVWLPALITEVIGFYEGGVRLVYMGITLFSVALLYKLVQRLFHNEHLAFWTAAFYGLTPMIAYFGAMPSMFHLGLLAGLLFANVMVMWLKQPTRMNFLLLSAISFWTAWSTWAGVVMIGCFGIAGFLLGKWRHRREMILVGFTGIIAVVLLLIFYEWQESGSVERMLDSFIWRSSNQIDNPGSRDFTFGEFLITTLVHMTVFVTFGILVMMFFGAVSLWKRSDSTARGVTLAILAGGVAYQIIFRNASIVHDYYKIPLVPSIALFAAAAWVYLKPNTEKQQNIWLRPLLTSLLIVSTMIGIGIHVLLLSSYDRPWLDAAIETINTHTQEGDVIMTNLEGNVNLMPLQFYTFRTFEAEIPADKVEGSLSETHRHYLYCPDDDVSYILTHWKDAEVIPTGSPCILAVF